MGRIGCMVLLGAAAWLALEVWVFVLVAKAVGGAWFGSPLSGVLPLVMVVLLGTWFGVTTAKRHGSRIVAGFLQGNAGRHAVGLVGGILIAIPGLLLKVPGLLLLLPPVQRLLAGLGQLVLGAELRRQMGKMFGGAMPGGMPAGFPGGPFPGMAPFPGRPDERRAFPKAGKTIDTTAERP